MMIWTIILNVLKFFSQCHVSTPSSGWHGSCAWIWWTSVAGCCGSILFCMLEDMRVNDGSIGVCYVLKLALLSMLCWLNTLGCTFLSVGRISMMAVVDQGVVLYSLPFLLISSILLQRVILLREKTKRQNTDGSDWWACWASSSPSTAIKSIGIRSPHYSHVCASGIGPCSCEWDQHFLFHNKWSIKYEWTGCQEQE